MSNVIKFIRPPEKGSDKKNELVARFRPSKPILPMCGRCRKRGRELREHPDVYDVDGMYCDGCIGAIDFDLELDRLVQKHGMAWVEKHRPDLLGHDE